MFSPRGLLDQPPNDMAYFGPPPPGWDREEFLRTAVQSRQEAASVQPQSNTWVFGLILIVGFIGLCVYGAIKDHNASEARQAEWTPTSHTIRTIHTDENGDVLNVKTDEVSGMTSSDGFFVPAPL